MQLTLDIPEQHVPFFKDLVQHLSFPVTVEDTDTDEEEHYEEPTQEQLKAEMRQAVQELNLIIQGKLKSRPVKELLDELQR